MMRYNQIGTLVTVGEGEGEGVGGSGTLSVSACFPNLAKSPVVMAQGGNTNDMLVERETRLFEEEEEEGALL